MLRFMIWLARFMAILGGVALTSVVALTTVSVTGRGLDEFASGDGLEAALPAFAQWMSDLGLGPVPGDFELVEAIIAFAIFAFLPICQMMRGHATVDIFANAFPDRLNSFLSAFWEVVLTLVILLIAWRLGVGFIEKLHNGQTTFFLQFPVWWSYGASLFAAVIAAIVAVFCAYGRVREAMTGQPYLPSDEGSAH